MKYGLRQCFYIGQGAGADQDPANWTTTEPARRLTERERKRFTRQAKMRPDTPLPILADALEDNGGMTYQCQRVREAIGIGQE